MKSPILTLGTTLLIAFSFFTASICANEGHHGHEKQVHIGGHMDHMNDVLQTLKRKLGDDYNQPVPAATAEQLATGKRIFSESCVACHGASGKGDGLAAASLKQKPADFTDPEHSKYYSDQGRIFIIENGVAETPMTAWKGVLSQEEILSVHAYVRSLRRTVTAEKHGHAKHTH